MALSRVHEHATGADLAASCEALGLHLNESQLCSLQGYLDLLLRWNAIYNLTALRDRGRMLTHHLLDCLAVVEPLRRQVPEGARSVVDVGSGGGLPGALIAIALPDAQVCCVDAIGKKAAFVRQVAAELELRNLSSVQARIESVERPLFDVVVSRAFASLSDFVGATRHVLSPGGGVWMAMKGKVPRDEIAELPQDISVFHVEQLDVPGLAAERCLVWARVR
ncbi:MAG: 16S rRNA (guanine(527)-N(7))-methyltransferase RsmG [Caldimonas sp.]